MFKNLIAPVCYTKRFQIRLIDQIDARDLFEICSNKEVTKYLTFEPYRFYNDAKKVIVNMIRAYYQSESINFSIVDKITLKMIASVSLSFNIENNCAEIGYLVNRSFWNQQVMSEIIPEIINIAFNYYKLDYIVARTTEDNETSRHLLEKFSFKLRCVKKSELNIHNEFKNICYYDINYFDFLNLKSH